MANQLKVALSRPFSRSLNSPSFGEATANWLANSNRNVFQRHYRNFLRNRTGLKPPVRVAQELRLLYWKAPSDDLH
jgi:hypothetical protein